MKEITLTREELNELLTAMQEHREVTEGYAWSFKYRDMVVLQMPVDDFFNFVIEDDEEVIFNIIDKNGKLLLEDDFIFMFIFCKSGVVRVGTINGEKIILDDIISK